MPKDAPFYSALLQKAAKNQIRMHMPGHKGKCPAFFQPADLFAVDYTELPGTGNLYRGIPPISCAEEAMAKAAGAAACYFLSGGSTQGIFTALSVLCPPGSTLIVSRCSHQSVYHAMAHLDLQPGYLYPELLEPFGIAGPITPAQVQEALENCPAASAVAVTSPSYYGILSDIPRLAEVTNRFGVPLFVDEAHGAHLPFLQGFRGAASQGASLSAASAHKTLPVLTAGACLYAAAGFDPRELRRKAALFGTSSPSYAVMASMDAARAYLEQEGGVRYGIAADFVKNLRKQINARGVFRALEDADGLRLDPTRLTVCTAVCGLSGYAAAERLESDFHIVCELMDERNVVFIITCADEAEDLNALKSALHSLEEFAAPGTFVPPSAALPRPIQRLSPRAAVFAPREYLALKDAAGRIAGEHLSPYPPGIPVVAEGEEIGEEHLSVLRCRHFEMGREIAVIKE